jgi:hypothetical protein
MVRALVIAETKLAAKATQENQNRKTKRGKSATTFPESYVPGSEASPGHTRVSHRRSFSLPGESFVSVDGSSIGLVIISYVNVRFRSRILA